MSTITEPTIIGAFADVQWENEVDIERYVYISFGTEVIFENDVLCDSYNVSDLEIFYYAEAAEWEELKTGAQHYDGWRIIPSSIEYNTITVEAK